MGFKILLLTSCFIFFVSLQLSSARLIIAVDVGKDTSEDGVIHSKETTAVIDTTVGDISNEADSGSNENSNEDSNESEDNGNDSGNNEQKSDEGDSSDSSGSKSSESSESKSSDSNERKDREDRLIEKTRASSSESNSSSDSDSSEDKMRSEVVKKQIDDELNLSLRRI